jgi:hypothetical protein
LRKQPGFLKIFETERVRAGGGAFRYGIRAVELRKNRGAGLIGTGAPRLVNSR